MFQKLQNLSLLYSNCHPTTGNMSGPLAGKTALITGGSKGIGAATSLLLAKSGANVAINYSSDSSAAEDIAKQIGHEHSLIIKGDAGRIPDIERMVSETVNKFGKIDIVIPFVPPQLVTPLFKPFESSETLSRGSRTPPESIVLTWTNTTDVLVSCS